jgi:heme A synthase
MATPNPMTPIYYFNKKLYRFYEWGHRVYATIGVVGLGVAIAPTLLNEFTL